MTQRRCNFNKKGYEWWEFRYAQNKNEKDSVSGDEAVEVSGLCLNIQRIKDTEYSRPPESGGIRSDEISLSGEYEP